MVRGGSRHRRGTSRTSSIADQKEVFADAGEADAKNAIPLSPVRSRRANRGDAVETAVSSRKASDVSMGRNESEEGSDQDMEALISPKSDFIPSQCSAPSSVSSKDSLADKSKEQLIHAAQELEAQFEDLIKIYQQEKQVFLEKSIRLLEKGEHPSWMTRLDELKGRREQGLRVIHGRRSLQMECIVSQYNFWVKNIADELAAAEEEIIDEFTSKRKLRSSKTPQTKGIVDPSAEVQGTFEDFTSAPRIALTEKEIRHDLGLIEPFLRPHTADEAPVDTLTAHSREADGFSSSLSSSTVH